MSSMYGDIGVVVELDQSSEMYDYGKDCDLDNSDILLPAMVHQLLSRQEMLASEDALNAVKKEAKGLESKGTWDLDTVREADAIREEARRLGVKTHFGSLMGIL